MTEKEAAAEKKSMTYKDAGVDVDEGDICSAIMYEASKKTWANRQGRFGEVREDFENFAGTRAFDAGELRAETKGGKNSDGIGTKMEVAERMVFSTGDFKYHKTLAHCLTAMVVCDADVRGAESVMMTNTLDVSKMDRRLVQVLADGLVEACELGGVANISGEIAELSDKVGGYGGLVGASSYFLDWLSSNAIHSDPREIQRIAQFIRGSDEEKLALIKERKTVNHTEVYTKIQRFLKNPVYNWSASLLWVQDHDKVIDGKKVKPGQSIVALYEPGFGSNGLSLARKILRENYGQEWHMKEFGDKKLGELVLTPCRIYTKAIREMHGGYGEKPQVELTGIAHITGGGIGKLGRVLKASGYGAELTDLFEPPSLMRHCQELREITDETSYTTWCMGQRMMIITPEPAGVIEIAGKYGFEGKDAGKVIAEPKIYLTSKGYHQNGDVLTFDLKTEGK